MKKLLAGKLGAAVAAGALLGTLGLATPASALVPAGPIGPLVHQGATSVTGLTGNGFAQATVSAYDTSNWCLGRSTVSILRVPISVSATSPGKLEFTYMVRSVDSPWYDPAYVYLETPSGRQTYLDRWWTNEQSVPVSQPLAAWAGQQVTLVVQVNRDGWCDPTQAIISDLSVGSGLATLEGIKAETLTLLGSTTQAGLLAGATLDRARQAYAAGQEGYGDQLMNSYLSVLSSSVRNRVITADQAAPLSAAAVVIRDASPATRTF